jgi:pSer/pThr/pTyr-binding forkhead associated (FHA) protein
MILRLRLEQRGSTSAEAFQLEGKLSYTIGRVNADVIVEDDKCSRSHGLFYIDKGKLHVRDLGSRNGITIGKQKVAVSEMVKGASIQIGAMTIFVEDYSVEDPAVEKQKVG